MTAPVEAPVTPDLQALVADIAAGLAERMQENTLLDRPALARRLGVSERTVSVMVHRGDLPHPLLHTSGVARWSWSQVEKFLVSRQGRKLAKVRGGRRTPRADAAKGKRSGR
jgi:predicted DNA-binding transcriptional regulator AlpA